ncbi:hypothetical protein [Solimicrobium silvestre]|uniref:Cofactor-independent phosphoglycerate mutase n=1 Tax=Solimicrobium silvestre TaxID=2099400 RepID=A0A2S9GZ92_9BURK|nr:hypothetical protein [Solimicrobium silvestre]PRC93018.1 hypothetical protein S2091_2104 [Solimicrobium silvestre]
MSHPEIIIPFSLPPAEHAKDLVKMLASECGTDGLAMLLSRHQTLKRTHFDDFSPELPHETWLTKTQQHSNLQQQASTLGVELTAGHWFILNPVHLHIARNHLVLTDYRQLALSEPDSILLYQKAQALCEEVGLELVYGNATSWFLRANDWADFATSTPDAACGHNIEIWSAKGQKELAWRKLQNEIQMEWFIHPLQEQRERRAEKVVNGLWLWGGTALKNGFKAEQIKPASPAHSVENFILTPQLTVLDQLSAAALANDWGTWAAGMIELERSWFKPLYTALKDRKLKQLHLHLSNSNTLLSVQTSGNALRKFWCVPTLKNLIDTSRAS